MSVSDPLGSSTQRNEPHEPTIGRTRVVLSILLGFVGMLFFLLGAGLSVYGYITEGFQVADWRFSLGLGLLIASIALMLVLYAWNSKVEHISPALRRLLYGYNTFLACALLAGILVIVNILAYKYVAEPLDLTNKSIYTLSEQTTNLLRSLERPVTVIVVYPDRIAERFNIQDMLDLYQKKSTKVRAEYVDPYVQRTKARELLQQYPDLSIPGIVVRYGEGEGADHVAVSHTDIFTESSDMEDPRFGRPPQSKFRGEEVVTGAIDKLTGGKTDVKLYFTTGFGQLDLDDSNRDSETGLGLLRQQLTKLNLKVEQLDLVREPKVPDDATLVVVPGPRQPMAQTALQALRDYLGRGGKLIAMLDTTIDRTTGEMVRTGLEDLLAEYDVETTNHRVLARVLVLFGGVGVTSDITTMVADAQREHPVARSVLGLEAHFPQPRVVRPAGPPADTAHSAPQRLRAVTLLETGKNAWAESNLTTDRVRPDSPGNLPGPLSLAVAVSESSAPPQPPMFGRPPPPTNEKPRLIVFGDADFLANAFGSQPASSSYPLFMNSVNWLRGRLESIGIPPKEPESLTLTVSASKAYALVWVPTVSLLVFLITCGVSVWIIRHRF